MGGTFTQVGVCRALTQPTTLLLHSLSSGKENESLIKKEETWQNGGGGGGRWNSKIKKERKKKNQKNIFQHMINITMKPIIFLMKELAIEIKVK